MKILRFCCCAVFGINVVNYCTACNMGSFKFAKSLCCQPVCYFLAYTSYSNVLQYKSGSEARFEMECVHLFENARTEQNA